MILDIVKIILPGTLSFIVGILITPIITGYLYKHKMWKKIAGKIDAQGNDTPIFNSLHKDKEVNTPRMGGVVIWLSASIVIGLIWLVSIIIGGEILVKLDFLSRNQTWVPLAALLIGAFVGLIDDYLEIRGVDNRVSKGLSAKKRLTIVGIVALLVASWFFFKLDVTGIMIPFLGEITIGWLIIPLFVFVTLIIYSGGVIDGLDGLSGGVFGIIFSAYVVIAFSLGQIDLAAFCAALVGAILAFLWFNIPPARFYMSETGSMALTVVLAIVAFMTDSIGGGVGLFVLSIIAFPLIATAGSSFIQIMSKKIRGKKIFISAPLHHHFEALGWPAYKVVMRYWIISTVLASIGIVIALVG